MDFSKQTVKISVGKIEFELAKPSGKITATAAVKMENPQYPYPDQHGSITCHGQGFSLSEAFSNMLDNIDIDHL
jgi:hypothetical protein